MKIGDKVIFKQDARIMMTPFTYFEVKKDCVGTIIKTPQDTDIQKDFHIELFQNGNVISLLEGLIYDYVKVN